jgi:hypothetical protein
MYRITRDVDLVYNEDSLRQACATSGPRAACGPRNSLFRPTAITKVLSFVQPAISNIERSKTVKEFLIARAPNK